MNYSGIKKYDIANGPGVRVSLFVSGCRHHCEGCFNPETWDFNYGNVYTPEVEAEILEACAPDYITGLSLLGGEPMEPENQPFVLELLRKFKARFPEKTVWCYSGYLLDEHLLAGKLGPAEITKEILSYLDVLVDGEFHIKEKDLSLRFRGSCNQRVIRVKESIANNEIVHWNEEEGLYEPNN